MSQKIAIVGAGQSGLPLAISLLEKGYEITLISNRTPEDIRNGKVLSSQCMFHDALQIERDFGLNQFEKDCPPVEGIGFMVPHPEVAGTKAIDWAAPLKNYGQSVDQRVKIPAWIELFVAKGGNMVYKDVGISDLEELAASNDLVVVSAGKGEIVKLFERDVEKSPFDKPQRALALTYVTGMKPMTPFSRVGFNLIPGVGEYFVFPALTTTGPCEIMVFEGVPGGPWDCWDDVKTPAEHLAKSKALLEQFLPWEAARCQNIALTDDNGILAGRVTPTTRKPIGRLPSGKIVLGMGDAVCVNDPITGQGSNNVTKAFKIYYESILAQGTKGFDAAWMQETFDKFWDYANLVVAWTNSLLQPPPEYIVNMLGAAGQCPPLASAIANNFNNPPDFFPWWADADTCNKFIESKMKEMA